MFHAASHVALDTSAFDMISDCVVKSWKLIYAADQFRMSYIVALRSEHSYHLDCAYCKVEHGSMPSQLARAARMVADPVVQSPSAARSQDRRKIDLDGFGVGRPSSVDCLID